ncbi:MAG TPA: glycogen/starch/alpha-glucan phosphorylase [Clostridiales bacterium]|jgi:starch phosphorylase|nr:glycogen/starch/alpha-glucan phosphorylase [Clostridiales bacterium]
MDITITASELYGLIRRKLLRHFGRNPEHVRLQELYKATCMVVRDFLAERVDETFNEVNAQGLKQVYYLSMEFLPGTSLRNHAFNLGIEPVLREAVAALGRNLDEFYEMEPDAGLGNGGLGRLASCYLDALATERYPGHGMSICYEYGIFKQKIVDGRQTELPDDWTDLGGVWLIAKEDEMKEVHFGGRLKESWDENGRLRMTHTDYRTVLAVPQEMMVSGYRSSAANSLILWESRSPIEIDMEKFAEGKYLQAMEERYKAEIISQILYPADEHIEGKTLRLQQQYFFVSASLQMIVDKHLMAYGSLDLLADKIAIHINDTHPTLAIPELMRILMDDHDYSWNEADSIARSVISYTNHTVMPEALERWPEALVAQELPRIHSIISEINNRQSQSWLDHPEITEEQRQEMAIIHDGNIRMANLCVETAHTVNGVSELHSQIIKDNIFKGFSSLKPEKFINVTNGIAYRRWLNQANPKLAELLDSVIGPAYRNDARRLAGILPLKDDVPLLARLAKIKRENKVRFSNNANRLWGVQIDPDSLFDVQVKRIHEYKRQLLNLIHIIDLYLRWQEDPNADLPPRTFIFAGKAAPSYFLAKEIIRLAYHLGQQIDATPKLKDKLKVLFMENYAVSMSEWIMPAAELSEQISLAGKEASGTGNMKLMLNGAITIGTLDGANVEIHRAVGDDNMFLFGMTAEEVGQLLAENNYNPWTYVLQNPSIARIIDFISHKINGESFAEILNYLTTGFQGSADPFCILADFESYRKTQQRAGQIYQKPAEWNRMSLINIGNAGIFSADRSAGEYASKIWKMSRL